MKLKMKLLAFAALVAFAPATLGQTLIQPFNGGTGVRNTNTKTITLGGPLVTTGAFTTTLAAGATATITLPALSATLLYSGGPGGTPSSLVGTNITGTAAGLTAGVASAVAGSALTGTSVSLSGGVTQTAFANATTLLTIGGTGASSVFAIPGTLDASGTTAALTNAGGFYNAKAANIVGILTLSNAIVGPATATVFNTVSTTVNAFGAASTALNIGNASGLATALGTWSFSGNVGIGTTGPLAKLAINGGLHVGGDSDPGDNNALIDGTLAVTGAITSNATTGVSIIPTTGTSQALSLFTNTGGNLFFGMDSSTASVLGTAGNYGTVIHRPVSTGFAISRTSTVDFAISSAGAVTIPGTLGVTGAITGGGYSGGAVSSTVLTESTGAAWTDYTPTISADTGTWGALTVTTAKYRLLGKTLFLRLRVSATVASGLPTQARILLPAGATSAAGISGMIAKVYNNNGVYVAGSFVSTPSVTYVSFGQIPDAVWVGICGWEVTIAVEIA